MLRWDMLRHCFLFTLMDGWMPLLKPSGCSSAVPSIHWEDHGFSPGLELIVFVQCSRTPRYTFWFGGTSLLCTTEQPCMQGKGVTACLAAWVLLLLL
jgi:hypothetical protein